MNGALLIFGGEKDTRDKKILEIIEKSLSTKIKPIILESLYKLSRYPDVKVTDLEEEKKSIGISQTKEATKFLQEKPFYYGQKIVVIQNADKMTTEAQNSLLKTLEEPPATALIILNAKNEDSLLETVRSRCKKLNLGKALKDSNSHKLLQDILKMPIGERLVLVDEIASENKEEVVNYLEQLLREQRELLIQDANLRYANNAKKIGELIRDLETTNVSAKFGLELLFMEFQ